MDSIMQIEILKIVQHILWLISAFWLGYEMGKQYVYTKLIEKDKEMMFNTLQKLKNKADKYEFKREE